jgi:glycosyltransferase involved in cell wall biosynthesis
MGGSKNIIDWGGTQASDVASIRDLIKHFDLKDNVVIDFFSLDEMPALYNIADVVLYPSNAWEPFGMTMLESMACKKPIIVTRTGGMPEVIQDGVNGFVVPVRDYEKIAMLIMELLKDPERCDRLGETGYTMVQEMYTEDHVTDSTLALYDKLL